MRRKTIKLEDRTMARRTGVRSESWTEFHKKHHSKTFHFSCGNERMLRACYRAPVCHSVKHEEEQSWLSGMLDFLWYRHRATEVDDDEFGATKQAGRGEGWLRPKRLFGVSNKERQ